MTSRLTLLLIGSMALAVAQGTSAPVYGRVEPHGTTRGRAVLGDSAPTPVPPRLRTFGRPDRPRQGFGFGGPQPEIAIVAQFDRDGDGRLNAPERRAARDYLSGGFSRERTSAYTMTPGPRLTPADVRSFPNAPVYDLGTLRTFFLQFDAADWEQELTAFFNTDVEVPATLIVDGKTYEEVGVHFRGNSSFRMVPSGYKHSLNLSLDFVKGKQDLGSYQTFNLLNSNNDATFVRTVLYSEIAKHYIPTPATNFVRVVINGESWGIYVSSQQFNGDFLRDMFKTKDGTRWKVPGSPRGRGGLEYLGENVGAYRRIYEIKSDDTPKAWTDLIALTRVLNQTPSDQLEAALAPILDVDGTLKFLALEVALVNSDGYWTRASDYNIYQDVRGQFHIIPHDVNEALGSGDGRGGFGGRSGPEMNPLVGLNDNGKPLRYRLLAVPALRQRYLGYVRDIAQRWLDWKVLEPMVTKYQKLIEADVKADTRKLDSFEAFTSGVADLRSFVERRRTYLLTATAPQTAE